MGSVASDILTRLFEASGVPIEEFYEAYVPAKPPEEGEDARFSQAHEHGWRPQGHRQPPPARSASARCLIVAKEQAHSPDRLPGVREGLPAGRRLQGQAVLCACFPQRVRDAAPGSLRLPEGRKRGDAQRGQAEAQGGLPRFLDELPGSWDLVVSARPEAAEAALDELHQEFVRSLRKLVESGKLSETGTR